MLNYMALTGKEERILKSIKIASENDPSKPEFPADDPKFPATPTYRIEVPGFDNVWLKDESYNPTGTHKDRLAWEIIVTYKDILLAKKRGQIKGNLPEMSIISSGSAATAIQVQLKKYKLPSLRVLVDKKMDNNIVVSLEKAGCKIFKTDLSKKALNSEEILKLTKNETGFDITSSDALDPTTRFYDWLSFEIINSSPDYCFVPFGSGHLYENILNNTKKVVTSRKKDPRFKGNIKKLRDCNFIGATTGDIKSKAEKLYSPHLPFVNFGEQWIRLYRYAGYCGKKSNVYDLNEKYLDMAIKHFEKIGVSAEPSACAGLAMLFQIKKEIPKKSKILIVSTGNTKYV